MFLSAPSPLSCYLPLCEQKWMEAFVADQLSSSVGWADPGKESCEQDTRFLTVGGQVPVDLRVYGLMLPPLA